MSIEKINQAKAEIASTSAYKTIMEFFDENSFCEIDAFAKSGEGFAGSCSRLWNSRGYARICFCAEQRYLRRRNE